MIRLIEALNFKCLRNVRQPLQRFHVLVGPNASGKTTFLDVIAFLGRLVSDGLEEAVGERTRNFRDLVWGRAEEGFQLAIEADIPQEYRGDLPTFERIRYEVSIGLDPETHEPAIRDERALLKTGKKKAVEERTLFPMDVPLRQTIMTEKSGKTRRLVFRKVPGGNDYFYPELNMKTRKWIPSFKFGPRRSTFGNLPEDESKFPVSIWLKRLLTEGVQTFTLNSLLIRKASPPGQGLRFRPDGSNLPWVIEDLRKKSEAKFDEWIAHVRTALPDIETIRTVEREDDHHRYMVIHFRGGLEVPSWMASDGTLRLLALTLPAYLQEFKGVYLIEEPENGIHPRAVETVLQSLSSVYDAQVLLATHSPVILSSVEAADVLCFAKTSEGATDIVPGDKHPALKEWQGETNLGVLFAGGVLGE